MSTTGNGNLSRVGLRRVERELRALAGQPVTPERTVRADALLDELAIHRADIARGFRVRDRRRIRVD